MGDIARSEVVVGEGRRRRRFRPAIISIRSINVLVHVALLSVSLEIVFILSGWKNHMNKNDGSAAICTDGNHFRFVNSFAPLISPG